MNDDENSKYKKGDIVKNEGGKAYKKGDEDDDGMLPNKLEVGKDVELTKIYSTTEGLHTDKTATAHDDDGRTFDLTLESWYTEKLPPYVGMILDASGSMGFASDTPTPINVEDIEELKEKVGLLNQWGKFTKNEDVSFPQKDSLIGYYEFRQNTGKSPYGDYRTWFLNTKSFGSDPTKYDYGSNNTNVFAKVVHQPTNDTIDFTEQQTVIQYKDYDKGITGWGAVPLKFNDTTGLCLDYTTGEGMLLEKQPNIENFTLSFSLNQTKSIDNDECKKRLNSEDIEILYIGALTGNVYNDNYFHVIRSGKDIVAMMGNNKEEPLFTLSNVYSTSEKKHTLTFVFDNNEVKVYLDGMLKETADVSRLSGSYIVFDPFKDKFEGDWVEKTTTKSQIFWVDNIYVYNTALEEQEIKDLISWAGKSIDKINKNETVERTDEVFLDENELALVMNPHNTDNSKLGAAGYSYFVYQPKSGTMEYTPLGYYKDGVPGTMANSESGEGWYFSSYTSTMQSIKNEGTAKTLRDISNGVVFSDTIRAREFSVDTTGVGAAPDVEIDSDEANTNFQYIPENNSPVKFYIDRQGYLRCFFATGNNDYYTSYVYELSDRKYVKTEALQRALGDFVTRLSEKSPQSKVSAVRFSTDKFESLSELVLLDWTDDASMSANILSLQRGNGVWNGYDDSNNLKQYNYFLTGGTSTITGLNAFNNYLKTIIDDNSSVGDKYLIIFTDGIDDNAGSTATENIAKQLKEKGYTIFTVLLNGGPVKEDGEQYEAAQKFLLSLSGKSKYDKGETADDYFFSVAKGRRELGDAAEDMLDSDVLTYIFANKILDKIAVDKDNYTVQDYIDPRFNLVDVDGNVWELGAEGTVEVNGKKHEINEDDGVVFKISKESDSDENSQNPTLYYKTAKDMYYLVWTKQNIPGCAIGANKLQVWNATFTVKAKDDFIGGNAVLTNGNEEEMNYVFNPTDGDKSSGTDDCIPKNTNDLPSKGFPRVSVNVTPPEERFDLEQTIYMGEELNAEDIAKTLIEAAKEEAKNKPQYYYWEYATRFVNYFNNYYKNLTAEEREDPDNLINYLHEHDWEGKSVSDETPDTTPNGRIISNRIYELITNDELSVEKLFELLKGGEQFVYLPYIYLPDGSTPTNSTGNSTEHLRDVIGYLYFTVQEQADDTYPSYPNGVTYDKETRKSKLTMDFKVRSPNKRKEWNNEVVISDDDYERNTDYKPAAGKEVGGIEIDGSLTTYIVSGEIELQLEISKEYLELLKAVMGANDIQYSGELIRNYEDGEIINEPVGSFEINLGSDKIDELLSSDNDNCLINATFKYNPDFLEKGYIKEGKTGYVEGLPIGIYTVENISSNLPLGYQFTNLRVVKEISPYTQEGLFTEGTNYDKAAGYLAKLNDSNIELGYRESSEPKENEIPVYKRLYTDYRFGIFRVGIMGSVEISKIVSGNGSKTRDFNFTMTLEDKDGLLSTSNTFQYTKVDNNTTNTVTGNVELKETDNEGIYEVTFTLRHGESIIFTFPDGIKYSIEEEIPDGYVVFGTGQTGIFTDNTISQSQFVNTRKNLDLTISKEITGSLGDKSRLWTFLLDVTLPEGETQTDYAYTKTTKKEDGTIEESTGKIKLSKNEDGTYNAQIVEEDEKKLENPKNIQLKHNESIVIKGLPYGTKYYVTEEGANTDGYITSKTVSGDEETLTKNTTVAFNNHNPAGKVIINKTVDSLEASDLLKDFTFNVTLTPKSGEELDGIYTYVIEDSSNNSSVENELYFKNNGNGTYSVYLDEEENLIALKNGETIYIDGLPVGTKVVVNEESATGFTTTSTVTSKAPKEDAKPVNGQVEIADDETIYTFAFTNKRDRGNIEISKTVSGTAGDSAEPFEFNLLLTVENGKSLTGTYSYILTHADNETTEGTITYIDNENNTYTVKINGENIKLKDKESIVINGLPAGVNYIVSEVDSKGYLVTEATNASGTITKDNTVSVPFNNKLDATNVSLIANKTIKDVNGNIIHNIEEGDFSFSIAPVKENENDPVKALMGDNNKLVVNNKADGTIVFFEDLEYTKAGTYVYEVKEVIPETVDPAIEYDERQYIVVIQVDPKTSEDGKYTGELASSVSQYVIVGEPLGSIEFNNIYKTVNLTIAKKVAGKEGDTDKDWTFPLTLELPTGVSKTSYNYTLTYADETTKTGTVTLVSNEGKYNVKIDDNDVTLKDSESFVIEGLPYGTKYAVSENEADQDGYGTLVSDENGTLTANKTVLYINRNPAGGIFISKEVVSPMSSDKNDSFTFEVIATPDNNTTLTGPYDYTIYTKVVDDDGNESVTSDTGTLIAVLNSETGSYQLLLDYNQPITLTHGQSIHIDGLPKDTKVVVNEESVTGFTTTSTITQKELNEDAKPVNEVKIADDETIYSFDYTNTRDTNDLVVKKTIEGDAKNSTDPFTFNLSMEYGDSQLSGSYNYIITRADGSTETGTMNTGSQTFTLRGGESIRFKGLPVGSNYEVTETNSGNYKQVMPVNASGSIEGETDIEVTFVNTLDAADASLFATKELVYESGNKVRNVKAGEFSFSIAPVNEVENDPVTTLTGFKDGKLVVENDANGKITFFENLAYTKTGTYYYTIQEETPNKTDSKYSSSIEYDPASYIIKVDVNYGEGEQKGKLIASVSQVSPLETSADNIVFKNVYHTAALTITKEVAGIKGDTTKDWEFEVTLSELPDDIALKDSYGAIISETNGESKNVTIEVKDNKLSFKLKHNQTITIKDLPEGAKYNVTETDANKNYYTTKVDGNANGVLNQGDNAVTFTNTHQSTDLIVTKNVTGAAGDQNQSFTFKIKATYHDEALEGTFGSITFENGEATFTLKHGERVEIKGLPLGTKYEVTETSSQGYKQIIPNNASGTITTKDAITVSFTNELEAAKVSLDATKTIVDDSGTKVRNTKAGEFTFSIRPVQDYEGDPVKALMGDNNKLVVNNKVDGTIVFFENLEYTKTGTYYYEVKEEIPDSKNPAITYDTRVYTVKVDVELGTGANVGKLVATVTRNVLPGGLVDSIEFNNIYRVNLTVAKMVAGKHGDTTKDWHFEVTLSDLPKGTTLKDSYEATISGPSGKTESITLPVDENKLSFTLKHDQTITIEGLPYGTTYHVSEVEANQDGYKTIIVSGKEEDKLTSNKTVVYENRNPAGGIIISKQVVSPITSDLDKLFTFEVVATADESINLTNDTYDYTIYTTTVDQDGNESVSTETNTLSVLKENGSYQLLLANNQPITLKHGQSIHIDGLPNGVLVKVNEVAVNHFNSNSVLTIESQNSKTTLDNQPITIEDEETIYSFDYTNTREVSDLVISKTVAGVMGDMNKDWLFEVTLSDLPEDVTLEDSYQAIISDVNGKSENVTVEIEDNKLSFTLKHGQTITIENLPAGTKYSVVEAEANQNYYTTTVEGESEGVLSVGTNSVAFTNTHQSATLTVTKIVTGLAGDQNEAFTFKIEASYDGKLLEGTYGTMTFVKGEAIFTLKHNERIEISGLPAGTVYKVTETNSGNYVVTPTNGIIEGTLESDTTVSFENHLDIGPSIKIDKFQSINGGDKTKEIKNVQPNDTITYYLDITSIGDVTAENVIVTDVIPEGLQVVPNSISDEGKLENGVITWHLGDLDSGKNITVSFDVVIPQVSNSIDWINIGKASFNTQTGQTKTVQSNDVKVEEVVYSLKVEKTVTGSQGEKGRDFVFTMNLVDEHKNPITNTISYKLNDETIHQLSANEKGEYIFTLSHNQSITFIGIPKGTSYTVQEENLTEEGYTTTYTGTTSGILQDNASMRFINSKPVGVIISKEVVSRLSSDASKEFEFDIILTKDGYPLEGTYQYTGSKEGTISGRATIKLKGEESINIEGLPEGTIVTVTEKSYDDFDVNVTVNGVKKSNGVSVPISDNQKADIIFTNTRKTGSLTVTKKVTGSASKIDTNKAFTFIVTLGDSSINGTFGDMIFENGIAIVTLKHNESKSATGLPVGVTYKVIEQEANQNGYITFVTKDEGTITANNIDYVDFENHLTEPKVEIIKKQEINDGKSTSKTQNVVAGDKVTYYLTVTNNEDGVAENIVVTDNIPDGLILIKETMTPQGTISDDGKSIEWNLGNLKAGGSITVSFEVIVPEVSKTTSWKNVGYVNYDNPPDGDIPEGSVLGIESNGVTIKQTPTFGVSVEKTQSINKGKPTTKNVKVHEGDNVTYYLTVKNTGTNIAEDVIVSDVIPNGLILLQGSIVGNGKLASDGKTIVWHLDTIQPNEEIKLSFTVIVPKVSEETTWKNIATVSYSNDPENPGGSGDALDPNDPHGGRVTHNSNKVEIVDTDATALGNSSENGSTSGYDVDTNNTNTVSSGDDTQIQLWIQTAMASISGFALILAIKKRKELLDSKS